MGRIGSLARAVLSYARVAWWGAVAPHLGEHAGLQLVQAAILDESGRVLLGLRSDIRGWELPGGTIEAGEGPIAALHREIREETGLEIAEARLVSEYVRSGFRPHRAFIFRCGALPGDPVAGNDTLALAWFDVDDLPAGLLPWYRRPIEDACSPPESIDTRHERWGVSEIAAALKIDLATRFARPD